MPSLSVSIGGAQFEKFVQFASAGKDKDIARLDTTDTLGTRSVTAQADDKVGAMRRSAETKVHNEAARTAFRNSVAAIFGGERFIPPEVKKAMQLDDYGKGKPLTARRILTVKEAVDKTFNEHVAAAEAQARSKGIVVDDYIRALIGTAVKASMADKDALALVTKLIDRVLICIDKVREEGAVKEKAEALVASVADLRKAADGSKFVFEAGMRSLAAMNGWAFPKGVLQQVAKAADSVSCGELKKLKPGSGEEDTHKAVAEFSRNIDNIMSRSGANDAIDGNFGLNNCRDIAAAIMLARKCGVAAPGNIKAALESDAAKKLVDLYSSMPGRLRDDLGNADFYYTSKEGAGHSRLGCRASEEGALREDRPGPWQQHRRQLHVHDRTSRGRSHVGSRRLQAQPRAGRMQLIQNGIADAVTRPLRGGRVCGRMGAEFYGTQ